MKLVDKLSVEGGMLKRAKIGISLMRNTSKYIDEEKAPEGLDIKSLVSRAIINGNYDSLGEFHNKSLFLGAMWFQDAWNLNLDRLDKCVIHYSTPEGVVPFCTYNGLNVGQEIRRKHSVPVEVWEKKTGRKLKDDLWGGGPIS
ncbi:hypothetical protein AKJ43_00990 [candidate division MSBL1 archaeon SCGC-AAA261D19]|uniref:Radical SAM protein n=2 Tax=candidate division MSBL1 TaxID=215777 RepID=A0A133V8E8_9EURY|nr:hypothetical protein AKJ43_00990 [candidate division MSBL1 archaeon SCGC-AAA261D19]